MNKIYWLIIALFSTGILQAQEAEQMSLKEAVAYAQSNHSSVKKANLEVATAKAQVREFTSIGLPNLSGEVDYKYFVHIPTQLIPNDAFAFEIPGIPIPAPEPGYSETQFGTRNNLTLGINLYVPILDGSYFVGLKASKGLVELTKRQVDLSVYELKDVVTKAYLTVLIAEENRGVLENNIANLNQLIKETQAFFDNGMIEKLDVERLQLSLANLQTEKEALNRQVELAYNVLKFQMYYPLDQPIAVTDSLDIILEAPSSADLEGEISAENRIEGDILNQNIHLNQLNTKRFMMGYIPKLSAFATHQQVLQRDDLFDGTAPGFYPTTIVGLKLEVPIFDGFYKAAKIQQSKLDVEKFQLQLQDFNRGVELQVMNARENYNNAKSRLDNQDKNLILAEKILNTTKIKYREGVGSSTELSQAEQELYRTQASRLNALYELVVSKTDLDKALGK